MKDYKVCYPNTHKTIVHTDAILYETTMLRDLPTNDLWYKLAEVKNVGQAIDYIKVCIKVYSLIFVK